MSSAPGGLATRARTRALLPPLAIGCALAAVLGGTTGAAAAVVTPPPNTPNLALMVIQPADLLPGAVTAAAEYVQPPRDSGFSAQYSESFTTPGTTDGTTYEALTNTVAIGPSTAEASAFFANEVKLFGSAKGRALIRRAFVRGTAKRYHPKASDVTFTTAAGAGIGTDSFAETVTYTLHHASIHQVVVFFDDGTLYGGLALTAKANAPAPLSDATALATTIDAHIHSVLGTTGTTGASGTT